MSASFSTYLIKLHAVFLSKFMALIISYLSAIFEIAFGGYQHFTDILAGVELDLLYPAVNISKRDSTVYCVGKDDTSSSFVIGLGDRAKPLLSCGVPDLQFDFRPVDI